jgi:hypothetical protein
LLIPEKKYQVPPEVMAISKISAIQLLVLFSAESKFEKKLPGAAKISKKDGEAVLVFIVAVFILSVPKV